MLVGLNVADEHQSVVVLDLLHGRLSGQRVLDDGVSIHLIPLGGRLPGVLGVPWELKSLGSVELDTCPTFFTLVPWAPFTTFFWTLRAFWTAFTGALSPLASFLDASTFLGAGFLAALSPLGLASALVLGAISLVEVNQAILAW